MTHELREMVRARKGAIVNTASIAGIVAEPGVAGCVAAKHGAIGLTKAAAIEYASLGIRVDPLAPRWVETPMTAAVKSDSSLIAVMRKAAPIARPAQPDQVLGRDGRGRRESPRGLHKLRERAAEAADLNPAVRMELLREVVPPTLVTRGEPQHCWEMTCGSGTLQNP